MTNKEAEAKRVADEAARAEKVLAAGIEHRQGINREALAGLVDIGLNEEHAMAVVAAIVGGKIPNITINY